MNFWRKEGGWDSGKLEAFLTAVSWKASRKLLSALRDIVAGSFELMWKDWILLRNECTFPREKRFASHATLLCRLALIEVEYLVGQFDSGAPLLTAGYLNHSGGLTDVLGHQFAEVFDTNCGEIPPRLCLFFLADSGVEESIVAVELVLMMGGDGCIDPVRVLDNVLLQVLSDHAKEHIFACIYNVCEYS